MTTSAVSKNGSSSASEDVVVLDRIAAETILVPILGTSPLIVHRFSEKAKRQMLDKQQGRTSPKTKRDPKADYEAAFYRLEDGGYGFPTLAFKGATVGGARFYGNDVTMTALKQCLFFHGEMGEDGHQLARIEGEPRMREDVVCLTKSKNDLRYRPEFLSWRTELQITFVSSVVARESVLSLIDAGGMGVGVGEWRPEKNGDFGTYRIDTDREIEVIK